MFRKVEVTERERTEIRRGDDLVVAADVVIDRGLTVTGTPEEVWPWIVQLGKWRAGWYLSRRIERILPYGRRAARRIDARYQRLSVGDVIPDYGGRRATFTVAEIQAPHILVYESVRKAMALPWSITLVVVDSPSDGNGPPQTRVLLRLRMGPIKRLRLAKSVGGLLDLLTIAALGAGLRERCTAATG